MGTRYDKMDAAARGYQQAMYNILGSTLTPTTVGGGSGCGESAGTDAADAVLTIGSLLAYGLIEKAETRATLREHNSWIINGQLQNYQDAVLKVETIKENITTAEKELEILNTNLNEANNKKTLIAAEQGKLKALDEGSEKPSDEVLTKYNDTLSRYNLLEGSKTEFNDLKKKRDDAKTAQSNFQDSDTFTTSGNMHKTINITSATSDDQINSQITADNYKIIKDNKIQNPNEYQTLCNNDRTQARLVRDNLKAKKEQLDSDVQRTEGAFKTKCEILGLTGENPSIETEITKLKADLEGDTLRPAAVYYGQQTQYNKEIRRLDKLDVTKIEEQITKKEAEIDKLKNTDLPAAERALDTAKIALKADDLVNHANQAKSNYNTAKDKWNNLQDSQGKNGKDRNWWQKLWGTNRTDQQKQARQDYKKAKKDFKTMRSYYKLSGMTQDQLDALVKAGQITQQDIEQLRKNGYIK